MSIWIAVLLGLVQGLCEFLPVSSSGHLVLLQTICGVEGDVLLFDTLLHVGTLIAVCAVFYKELWEMLKKPFQKKVYLLLVATVVTSAIALLFEEQIEALFAGQLLGVGFLLTALILMVSEKMTDGKRSITDMNYAQAAGVGLVQAVAILPGVSRSGSTIAGSRFFGLNKGAAAEFSFILSIPAILGSCVLQAKDLLTEGTGGIGVLPVLVGMTIAAISGYFAIRWMLKLIKEKSLIGFAVYVGILGVLVLLDQYVTHIFF
ncbi:MAG: undecaprenyl-diphosphate phosphatase [Clostridia bacterium]|nr:undecaprenyl-diphosphate phosphatase [Clostridia bacterium]